MKFGFAEMAQTMESAKALITVAIVSAVGIGTVLGGIVALYRIFFRPRAADHFQHGPAQQSLQLGVPTGPALPTVATLPTVPTVEIDATEPHNTRSLVPRANNLRRLVAILIAVVGVGGAIGYYEWKTYTEVYKRLGIKPLSLWVEKQPNIRNRLDQLTREPCYKDAVVGLSDALIAAGYPRESATSLLSFAEHCGGPSYDILGRAYHAFQAVNDFSAALSVAEKLVDTFPASATFRYYRAQSYQHLKDFPRALDDYINVVQLLGEPRSVASSPFYNIALMYAALGRYCDAITPIETYVSFDPAQRQSTWITKVIAEYAAKGDCHTKHASGFARVRLLGASGVHIVSVVVNGVSGNFIFDTGATYVSVTPDFAKKANIIIEKATVISLKPVGSIISAYLTHADKIAVGSAEAQGVPVAVLKEGGNDPFGGRLDGLLGMSFLARFKVTLTQGGVELRAIPLR